MLADLVITWTSGPRSLTVALNDAALVAIVGLVTLMGLMAYMATDNVMSKLRAPCPPDDPGDTDHVA